MTVQIRTAYDDQAKAVSEASAVNFEVKKDSKGKVLNPEVLSKTVQLDKDSTDINLILKAAEKNGGVIMGASGTPITGDFTQVGDWLSIKNKVAQAEQSFRLLPADLRARFGNDVSKCIEFMADSANDKEAVKLGLKPEDVLKTALADDGVTKITPEERADLDRGKAEKAAAIAAGKIKPDGSPVA